MHGLHLAHKRAASALPSLQILPCSLLLSLQMDTRAAQPNLQWHLAPVPMGSVGEFLWYRPRAGMDESSGILIFNFTSTARLFSRMTVPVYTSTSAMLRGFCLPRPPQHLVLSDASISMRLTAPACQDIGLASLEMLFSAADFTLAHQNFQQEECPIGKGSPFRNSLIFY